MKMSRADRNPWLAKMHLHKHIIKRRRRGHDRIDFFLSRQSEPIPTKGASSIHIRGN